MLKPSSVFKIILRMIFNIKVWKLSILNNNNERLRDKAWPHDAIDEIFILPETKTSIGILSTYCYKLPNLMKSNKIDAIIALDDYDVEKTTYLRRKSSHRWNEATLVIL
jgi:hypothetical protein